MVKITYKDKPAPSITLEQIPIGSFFKASPSKESEGRRLFWCVGCPVGEYQKIAFPFEDAVWLGSDCYFGNSTEFYNYSPVDVELVCMEDK